MFPDFDPDFRELTPLITNDDGQITNLEGEFVDVETFIF